MAEKLVDVLKQDVTVLHTFPVTIGDAESEVADTDFQAKATQAAAHAQLVPECDFGELTTRMHVSRGGPLKPYGDDRDLLIETKQSLEQGVREHAYLLWEQDGSPAGRADDYWHQAYEQHIRERAYILWQQDGSPEGRAEEYWNRTHDFQAF